MNKPVLIIDPGHGGKDPGGGSNKHWLEKDKVLDISLYQYERFKELGVQVTLTRNKDIFIDSTPRTNLVKNSGAKYCISNHINAATPTSARGVETIHSIFSDGKLAKVLFDAIVAEGVPGRRVFKREGANGQDYYFMHRQTGSVETVIIEYGFATNEQDTKLIQDNWKVYAEAVVKAFCDFAGFVYSPPMNNDVSDWAKEAHAWVVKNGISDGTRPKDPVTREEVWTMLERMSRMV